MDLPVPSAEPLHPRLFQSPIPSWTPLLKPIRPFSRRRWLPGPIERRRSLGDKLAEAPSTKLSGKRSFQKAPQSAQPGAPELSFAWPAQPPFQPIQQCPHGWLPGPSDPHGLPPAKSPEQTPPPIPFRADDKIPAVTGRDRLPRHAPTSPPPKAMLDLLCPSPGKPPPSPAEQCHTRSLHPPTNGHALPR